MTAISALLLALISGWMVPAARLAMAAFLGPWLIALIYQTADIGLGYAVSPPQVVTQFPRVIGYVVVTTVILALGLILSALIGERRSRVVPVAGRCRKFFGFLSPSVPRKRKPRSQFDLRSGFPLSRE